jgi:sphingolipid delta-4 desaturase
MLIVSFCSWEMYYFLVVSTFFAGGLHPLAGHFIAEHYTVDPNIETFSYYGILNYVSYNVGYHNEHHDFPTIPWSKLPLIKKIAPEFYDPLQQCSSWTYCIYNYIVNDDMGPYSRVKRQ